MDLLKCPCCGEMYSPSYRKCPFCEEDDNPKKLRYDNRKGRHVSEKKKTHSARGAITVILVLVLGLLTWYLFGDTLLPQTVSEEKSRNEVQQSTETTPPKQEETDPGESSIPTGEESAAPQEVDVSTAKLSNEDFTAKAGEKIQLSVTGISDSVPVSWSSENAAVASVSDSGLVTAVSGGTTNILAVVGDKTFTCIARINGGASTAETSGTDVSGAALNYSDFTAKVGEKVRLKVTGTSASVSWSIGDSSVASVGADGVVKGLSAGQTKVYATVGGKTLSCTVRIK